MPLKFDAGHVFDSGLTYDSGPPGPVVPVPTRKIHRMNPFNLDLKNKTPEEKVALGDNHITSMDGNTYYPAANRQPTDAEMLAARDGLATSISERDALQTQLEAKEEEILAKEVTFDATISGRANHCAAAQLDNPTAWASTGLPLKSAPTPVGDLPAPENLKAKMSTKEGEIIVSWRSVYGARMYKLQMMVHGSGTWTELVMQSQVRFTVKGLISGTQYAFRVLAMGPRGEGPWSDEAVSRAP